MGAGDNGNVFAIANNKDTSRSQTFTYDPLNRLISAQNAGTDCTRKTLNPNQTEYWGDSYGYDAWGNLLAKTVTKCSAENMTLTALANNQLSGYGYDAAGNMTHDGTANLNYSYDQENRITGAAGFTYTYDADGNRVEKSNAGSSPSGTLYWYMSPGIVAESDLAGNLQSEYIFFDGERVARKDFPGNAVSYYFSDHLKTTDIVTDAQGNIKNESDFYPWGGELQFLNNDSNHYKFTGKERDNETGLDYFGARYYSNGLGRFISADWSVVPIPVPYSTLSNPQTLNLYSYGGNNPTTLADMDGHYAIPGSDACNWKPVCEGQSADQPKNQDSGSASSNSANAGQRTVQQEMQDTREKIAFDDEIIKGELKEVLNGYKDISPVPFIPTFEPSNPTQALGMKLMFAATLLTPEGGEAAAGKISRKIATKAEKAIIEKLTAEAKVLYPKLANKIEQDHHITPLFLGGAKYGPTARLNAAYHQLITNAFRKLAPYGRKFEGSVKKIKDAVYSRLPLP